MDNILKAVARFVIRPADQEYAKGDLVLGAMMKDQDNSILKPNHVYEIQEILGVLTIVDKGESVIGLYPVEATKVDETKKGLVSYIGWCSEVSYILNVGKGSHLISRKEILNEAI